MVDYPAKEKYDAGDLAAIVSLLRDPVSGCPWDRVQTHASIRKNFLEETYEVLEAIDAEDAALLREELGDVLMQVALHSQMEEEKGNFSFLDVCDGVCRKLLARHPHIFCGDAAESAPFDGLNDWDALKNREKGRKDLADELHSVPVTLPALMKAQKTQKRAEPYGAVPAEPAAAYQALEAAEAALKAALSAPGDPSAPGQPAAEPPALAQAGIYLFAAANWLRSEGIDAEEALEKETKRFHAAYGGKY